MARWNSDRAELAVTGTPDGLSGLITGISRVLDDGTAFVVGEIGVTRLENGAEPTGLADMADQRVAAVEVVDDQVYVATASGVFSAPVDGATAAGAFSPVDLPESTSDVTAIWSAGGRVWVGTGGGGLVATGDPVRTCGVAPPPDAVVRSAVTTGDDSFVVVTNDGVYDAWPPDAAEACDVRFEHRASADTNVAIPAGDYTETVAAQVPDRSRLIWAGADHGIDLIAWPGALRGVPTPVISAFDRLSFLDGSRVSALATVGGGFERTLVIGTDYGVYYHRPAVVPPRFAVESVASYDETGATTGPIVDCATVDCLDPLRFEHETRQLVMSMTVDDLGDADRFQFVVDEGGAAPTVSGRQLTLTTGRGRTESLTITALDLHLNASDPHELDLVVRQRTLREWFVETNAKWVAGLVAVALVAGVSGFWTVRWLRRRGRRRLIDAEVTVRPDGTGDLVVTTRIGDGEEDWSVRRIDAAELGSAWAQVRSTKDAVLVPELGDVLYDAAALARCDPTPEGCRIRHPRRPIAHPRPRSGARLAAVGGDAHPLGRADRSLGDERRPRPAAGRRHRRRADAGGGPRRVPRPRAGRRRDPERSASDRGRRRRGRGDRECGGRAGTAAAPAAPWRCSSTRRRMRCGAASAMPAATTSCTSSPTASAPAVGSRIWLEDEDGDAVRLERDEFVDLMAGRTRGARQPRLIVLNTCCSADGGGDETAGPAGAAGTTLVRTRRMVGADAAAASLAVGLVRGGNIPAVIGMAMQIRTPAAVAFSGAFYRTLFRHGQVDHAMLIGRREVQESDADWVAPRLYVGSPEPELFGAD